jgi:hypothetical protein
MDEETGTINWNSQLETILSQEGERALCYGWLHVQSQKKYNNLNTYITLPTITMSTLVGSAAIGSSSIFASIPEASNYIIGGVSLSVALLNTVSSFFGWAKRSESHRLSAIAYGKVHRFMMIELALPRKERMAARDMLKVTRDQLDRMQETSPQIPDDIIQAFQKKFGDTTPEVSKPGITNGLDPIEVYIDESLTPSRLSVSTKNLFLPRTSNDGRIQDNSQTLSSARPRTESAFDNNRT